MATVNLRARLPGGIELTKTEIISARFAFQREGGNTKQMEKIAMDKTTLKRETEKYWDDEEKGPKWYIKNLLPHEISYVVKPEKEFLECDLLVLMLGYTFDPLLHALAAYKPKQVLMVLNEEYDVQDGGSGFRKQNGDEFFDHVFSQVFKQLADQKLLDVAPRPLPDPIITAGDSPVKVFKFLRKHLLELMGDAGRRNDKKIVIDVTGAKKSMVAGAYLFAAFADVPVSYVDFKTYNPKKGRPYGYTCEINVMPDPSRTFRLREWQRVQQFYEQYAFRSARELVEEIGGSMRKVETGDTEDLFTDDERKAVSVLGEVLKVHESWDNGDYRGALKLRDEIIKDHPSVVTLPLPSAVTVLGEGEYWPHADDAETLLKQVDALENGSPSLYLDMPKLIVYANDELAKVERLVEYKLDYRSALLRAVGLTEVLFNARLRILFEKDLMEVAEVDENTGEPRSYLRWSRASEEVKKRRDGILKIAERSIYVFVDAFRYRDENAGTLKKYTEITVGDKKTGTKKLALRRTLNPSSPLISKNCLLDKENQLRNKAIHTYLSVPESIASHTKDIAQASVKEFEEQWVGLMQNESITPPTTTCAEWAKVCGACGINFLPPR